MRLCFSASSAAPRDRAFERRFDGRGIDVAHELADVLALAREAAAARDALGEQDGVVQPFGQASAVSSDLLERDQLACPDPARPRPRACARSCSGDRRIPAISSSSCIVQFCHASQSFRVRQEVDGTRIPELKSIVSDALKQRAGAWAPSRPRPTSACRRVSPPRCGSARSRPSSTSATAAWAITVYFGKRKGSASTADLSRARRAPKRSRRPATSRATPPRTSAPGSRIPKSWRATFRISTSIIPGRFRPEQAVELRARLRGRGPRGGCAHHQFRRRECRQPPGRARVRQFARLPRRLSLDQPQRELRAARAERRRHAARLLVLARRATRAISRRRTIIGRKAGERAVARLGARKIATQKARVLFAPEVARGLIGHFLGAVRGSSQYRKSSFLLGAAGQQVFPSFVEMRERPHIRKALGSSPVRRRRRGHARSRAGAGRRAAGLRARQLLGAQARAQDHRQCRRHAQPAGGIEDAAPWMIGGAHAPARHRVAGHRAHGAGRERRHRRLLARRVGLLGGERRAASYPVHEITIAGNLKDMYQQHRRDRQRRRPARRRARGLDPDRRDDHRRGLASGDGPPGLRWRRRAVRSAGKAGTCLRLARCACPRLTLFAPSRSRALRKFPDGNFRRPLVGSLRALTSAEMAALRCIAAARSGFLLAALHSVAKRVSRGQAHHPTRVCPRLPADRTARLRRHDPQLRSRFRAIAVCPRGGKDRKTRCSGSC